jgi:hypothetical protein
VTCHLADRDGAYVLGALSPAERLEFEQHLAGCAACARSVRELAGLPGLLAGVDPAVVEGPASEEPLPPTLLPALLDAVRRTRRRRRLATAGTLVGVAAASAAVVAGGFLLAQPGGSDQVGERPTSRVPATTAPAAPVRVMVPVDDAPVRASISLAPVSWGTRLDLSCTYLPTPARYHLPARARYALFVRTRRGHVEQVGTWASDVGRTMRLTAATSVPRADIASVEVRTTDGHAVLELTS